MPETRTFPIERHDSLQRAYLAAMDDSINNGGAQFVVVRRYVRPDATDWSYYSMPRAEYATFAGRESRFAPDDVLVVSSHVLTGSF